MQTIQLSCLHYAIGNAVEYLFKKYIEFGSIIL